MLYVVYVYELIGLLIRTAVKQTTVRTFGQDDVLFGFIVCLYDGEKGLSIHACLVYKHGFISCDNFGIDRNNPHISKFLFARF